MSMYCVFVIWLLPLLHSRENLEVCSVAALLAANAVCGCISAYVIIRIFQQILEGPLSGGPSTARLVLEG
jgi:hypothetical protein